MISGPIYSDPAGRILVGPSVTTANEWRWKTPRAPFVEKHRDPARARFHDEANQRRRKTDFAAQKKLFRDTGFPGFATQRAYQVQYELLARGYSRTAALIAALLVCTGGEYNFQGNARIAFWARRNIRTIRRIRAELEADGLIKTYLVLPGEQIPGQRGPVSRPRIVRDVSPLIALAGLGGKAGVAKKPKSGRAAAGPTENPKAGGSAARSPSAAETIPDETISRAPEWLRGQLAGIQRAQREAQGFPGVSPNGKGNDGGGVETPPPRPSHHEPAPPMPSSEIDAIERELLLELERQSS